MQYNIFQMWRKTPLTFFFGLKNVPLIKLLSTFISSVAKMPESFWSCSLSVHATDAGTFDCLQWLPHSDRHGQRALCTTSLEHKVPNPAHRAIENWKSYAVKQIKICTEYRDMAQGLDRFCQVGTPGLRSIDLNPKPPWPWVTYPGILNRS